MRDVGDTGPAGSNTILKSLTVTPPSAPAVNGANPTQPTLPVGYGQAGSARSIGEAQRSSPSDLGQTRQLDLGNGTYVHQRMDSVTGQWTNLGQPIPYKTTPSGGNAYTVPTRDNTVTLPSGTKLTFGAIDAPVGREYPLPPRPTSDKGLLTETRSFEYASGMPGVEVGLLSTVKGYEYNPGIGRLALQNPSRYIPYEAVFGGVGTNAQGYIDKRTQMFEMAFPDANFAWIVPERTASTDKSTMRLYSDNKVVMGADAIAAALSPSLVGGNGNGSNDIDTGKLASLGVTPVGQGASVRAGLTVSPQGAKALQDAFMPLTKNLVDALGSAKQTWDTWDIFKVKENGQPSAYTSGLEAKYKAGTLTAADFQDETNSQYMYMPWYSSADKDVINQKRMGEFLYQHGAASRVTVPGQVADWLSSETSKKLGGGSNPEPLSGPWFAGQAVGDLSTMLPMGLFIGGPQGAGYVGDMGKLGVGEGVLGRAMREGSFDSQLPSGSPLRSDSWYTFGKLTPPKAPLSEVPIEDKALADWSRMSTMERIASRAASRDLKAQADLFNLPPSEEPPESITPMPEKYDMISRIVNRDALVEKNLAEMRYNYGLENAGAWFEGLDITPEPAYVPPTYKPPVSIPKVTGFEDIGDGIPDISQHLEVVGARLYVRYPQGPAIGAGQGQGQGRGLGDLLDYRIIPMLDTPRGLANTFQPGYGDTMPGEDERRMPIMGTGLDLGLGTVGIVGTIGDYWPGDNGGGGNGGDNGGKAPPPIIIPGLSMPGGSGGGSWNPFGTRGRVYRNPIEQFTLPGLDTFGSLGGLGKLSKGMIGLGMGMASLGFGMGLLKAGLSWKW